MGNVLSVLALLWGAAANTEFTDPVQATCRIISPQGNVGTGCVTEVTGNYVGVLTNAHVVAHHATVKCQFYRRGFQSVPITATVAARSQTRQVDAALVVIQTSAFGGLAPKPVRIAQQSYVVQPGETIRSVGCANGAWPTAWTGHAIGYDEDSHLLFRPAPADGRSGSAIFNAAGEIVGLIFARHDDAGVGMACSVQSMRQGLAADAKRQGEFRYLGDGMTLVKWEPVKVQCGPGGCDPNGYSSGTFGGRRRPQKSQHDEPLQIWPTPWPGLGPQNPAPQGPSIDLTPIAGPLAEIAHKMPAKEPSPPRAEPDSQALSAVEKLGTQVNQNAADIQAMATAVPNLVKESMRPMAEKMDALEGVVKPLVRLKERLDAAEEAGGIKGRIAQRIEDRLMGEEDDPALKSRTIKVLVWVAISAAVIFVIVRVHNGTSALCGLRDRVKEKLAEKDPLLAATIESLEGRLHRRIDALRNGGASAVATPTPSSVPAGGAEMSVTSSTNATAAQ